METQLTKLITDGNNAFAKGEFEQAKVLFEDVLQQQEDCADAHYALGTIAFQSKDYLSSQRYLATAAELEPEAVDIAFNLASCYQQMGQKIPALKELQRATKYCKDDPIFCSRIAEILIPLGEPAGAISLLSRLQELTPKDQIILARAQGRLSNWREAVHTLKRLNESIPKDPQVANELAVAAGQLRDYKTAISAYEKYLRLVRPSANDYLRFADLLLIAQNATRCAQALEQATTLGEDGPELHVLKARVARLNGDYDAVSIALDAALERMPNHGQAWSIRAELADDESLKAKIDELQVQLEQQNEIQQLNHHHRTLLNFAQADMLDRVGNYQQAAVYLKAANDVQYDYLKLTNAVYQPLHTEQYADYLITNFDQAVFEKPNALMDGTTATIKPIFIVGMPRSGTTLVERILGQNEQVFNAGEQEAMEYVAADFRQKIAAQKLPNPVDISSSQWAELRETYLQKLPDISKPVFTDKLPHNFRQVGLILKLFPDARIIQMHRSIEDVCLSIYSHAFSSGHNYANRWQDLKHFHGQCEKLMAHWSSLNSPQILDLHYEKLVQKPEFYVKQLVQFCGFEWDSTYLDFHKSVNKSFTFSEMQVRQPIAAKRVERWRNYEEFIADLSELTQ